MTAVQTNVASDVLEFDLNFEALHLFVPFALESADTYESMIKMVRKILCDISKDREYQWMSFNDGDRVLRLRPLRTFPVISYS